MKRILLLLSLCLFIFTVPSKAADIPVRETDVTTASEGNDIVLLNGTFKYLTKEEILSRINEIRLEACKEGVPDPRNSSRSLTEGDYVEIKWSSDMEWIAQTRAAEATVHMDHIRPNNKKWSGVSFNGVSSNAEDLAWNSSADILGGINQWYKEKSDWVNQNSSAVTGHYTSIIDPRYTYIGIGAFKPSTGYGAVAGELKIGSGLSEDQTGAQGLYQQKVEIIKDKLTISSVTEKTIHIGKSETLSLNAETSYENDLGSSWSPKVSQVSLMGKTEWETNDSSIAAVNDQGLVTGASAGTTIITATYNGNDYKTDITVEDHKWVEQTTTPPTCTEPGSTTYKCSICDQTYEEETAATGHTWSEDYTVDKEATCTTEGSESIHCTKCNAIKEGTSRIIEKTDHTYGDWTVTKKASCTEAGSKERLCSNCENKEVEEIPATGHSFTKYVPNGNATCEEDGTKTAVCDHGCGTTDTIADQGSALGHVAGEAVVENKVDSTCTEEGSYDAVIYCTVCKKEISREKKVIEKKDHSWDEGVVTREATKDLPGIKTFTCTVCEETYTVEIPYEHTVHSYEETVVEPSCTEGGYTLHTCSVCGESYKDNETEALGHTPGEAVVENKVDATCEEAGSYDEVIYCTVCKEEISRENKEIEPKYHDYEGVVTKEPTCKEEGIRTFTCTRCDASFTEVIPKTKEHTWDEGIVIQEATDDEDGLKEYTCTVCGEKKTEVIPAPTHEHEYTSIVIDPTCTEGGYTLYTCSCGDSYKENEKDALGHSYKEEVTKETTCEDAGEKRYTCERCGETYTEEIPATGHKPSDPVKENEIAATFDSEGSYESVVYCSVCKKELSREKVVIPKLEIKDQTIAAAKTSYVFTFNSAKTQSQALNISGAHGTISYTSGNTKVYAKDGKLYVAKVAPAGTYTIKVTAAATEDGEYKVSNTITITVKVGKASNTIKVSPTTKKFKLAKVKKKAQSFKIKVTQAQGKITFKSSNSKVKVTATGKVTVKKGTKKGNYRITVTAAGNKNYNKAVKTVIVVVK